MRKVVPLLGSWYHYTSLVNIYLNQGIYQWYRLTSSVSLGGPILSHIVTIKTEVRDHVAVCAACRRLELPPPLVGSAQLFSGQVSGLIVRLPDWAYPVVVDTSSGQVHFDNFSGAWGDQAHLDRFLQIYAVEKARIEAQKKGLQVTEQTLADGSIKLTIRVGGGA